MRVVQALGPMNRGVIGDGVVQIENGDKNVHDGGYPAVFIPVTTQHYPMLQRNLVYTGITRGRNLLVLVGQTKALAMAVRGSRAATQSSASGWGPGFADARMRV